MKRNILYAIVLLFVLSLAYSYLHFRKLHAIPIGGEIEVNDWGHWWETYHFPYPHSTYKKPGMMQFIADASAGYYPISFSEITATLTNLDENDTLEMKPSFAFLKKVNDEWRIVPLTVDDALLAPDDDFIMLMPGESHTYKLSREMIAEDLGPVAGPYRIITEIRIDNQHFIVWARIVLS